jgi:protein ImuB
LRPISIAALRLEAECVQRLGAVGVETIADLMALGRDGLPSRFGPSLLAAMDRALGHAFEVLEPVRPRPHPRVERVFEGPTTSAMGIAIASREVVGRLASVLEAQGIGAMTLVLALDRVDAAPLEMMVRLSRPSRDGQHLWRLLAPRLERVNLGFGVEAITLTATRVGKVRHCQQLARELARADDLCESEGESEAIEASLATLIDTLCGRLGVERVLRLEAVQSHMPERAFGLRPVMSVMAQRGPRAARMARVRRGAARARSKGVWENEQPAPATECRGTQTPSPRPAVLLQPPEPAEVTSLVPDGPVAMVRWRGRSWTVLRTTGPERVAPEWWREKSMGAARATRDYFVLQLEGGAWIWACRESLRGAWFVHGVWA